MHPRERMSPLLVHPAYEERFFIHSQASAGNRKSGPETPGSRTDAATLPPPDSPCLRLLVQAEGFQPFVRFAVGEPFPLFLGLLSSWGLPTQFSLHLLPEVFRLEARGLSLAGGLAEPTIAADDRQTPGRSVGDDLLLDDAVGVAMEAREVDLDVVHRVERAFVRGARPVEDHLSRLAHPGEVLAQDPAQIDLGPDFAFTEPLVQSPQQVVPIDDRHAFPFPRFWKKGNSTYFEGEES